MSSAGTDKSASTVFAGEDRGSEKQYDLTSVISDEFGNELLVWPEGFYSPDYDDEPHMSGVFSDVLKGKSSIQSNENELWGEDNEGFDYYFYSGEQEEAALEEASSGSEEETPVEPTRPREESIRRSMFVHSSPINFPDVTTLRKSVFGSIFLRTTGHADEVALLQRMAESNYSMLQSLLNSFEKVLNESSSDIDRRQLTLTCRDSILRVLDNHGITRTYSDGSVHWDIYPISHSYLFSVQIGDRIHQTRHLSRIEDRVVTGLIKTLKLPYGWPTDSLWTGQWDTLGMAGFGSYVMPNGVSYNGKMNDGMFNDDNATLTYPSKFKALHCVYDKGKLINCQFQFPDMLNHDKENWDYCKFPDRRFWSEVRNGLKPAKIAQKTEIHPPRRIPPGQYDTNDGFYNPKSLILANPAGEMIRVPLCEEGIWIKKYCRKGFFQHSDFRPDLFENWFNYDQELIQTIMAAQRNFKKNRITYDELQQIYADLGLLGPLSKYKKFRTQSEIAEEEFEKTIPEPKCIKGPKGIKKYHGHDIHLGMSSASPQTPTLKISDHVSTTTKQSKSFFRFDDGKLKPTLSQPGMSFHSSKANVTFGDSFTEPQGLREDSATQSVEQKGALKKKLPDYIFQPYPILKSPFQSMGKIPRVKSEEEKRKCPNYSDIFDFEGEAMPGEGASVSATSLKKKGLKMYMKRIIMHAVNNVVVQERERDRMRLSWGKKLPGVKSEKKRSASTAACLKLVGDLFISGPEKEEYCDSEANKTCNLKKLSEDRYNMLLFWGKRTYLLDMEGEGEREPE